jgi:hypothetical protein
MHMSVSTQKITRIHGRSLTQAFAFAEKNDCKDNEAMYGSCNEVLKDMSSFAKQGKDQRGSR